MEKTYLINSTRKEYIYLGPDFPSKTGSYMQRLEIYCQWDLRHDKIYIEHTSTTHGYTNVIKLLSNIKNI